MARQTDHHSGLSAVSLPPMAGGQQWGAQPSQSEFFARNEALRRQRLREAARRPGGELLEQAMRLSSFATELAAAGRRARR
jgi:hypothetical protein